MKTLFGQIKKFNLQEHNRQRGETLVHFYPSNEGNIRIDPPKRADEMSCPFCDGTEYGILAAPHDEKIWMCRKICAGSVLPSHGTDSTALPVRDRAAEWASFCENNGIGDLHHGVRFEKIDQSKGKVDYLLKFACKPCGICLMQGGAGSGKTYASMGVCEYATRGHLWVKFTTQKKMLNDWLDTFKEEHRSNYADTLTNCNLLVVDDFGTAEISPGFMSFFMDLINTRTQWSNRGTILTTNLDDKKFSEYCGEALNDRIKTGQKLVFNNKTRRKPVDL